VAKTKIFISSVQAEFAHERQALHEYILADPLLGRFFEPFLFELLPATDQRADAIYLREVEYSHIYLGLFGRSYGFEDEAGISPTEREFNHASTLHKTRLIYLSSHTAAERDTKENALIQKAQSFLVRKRFSTVDELKSAVYASLVHYLIEKEIIRTGPFDAAFHLNASLEDIDEEKVRDFVRVARSRRGFPFQESAPIEEVFTHLNLINEDKLTNAALLLFGKAPQRFFITSEVRCAHFHGTIVEKPIPSYKVFKGDVFDLVDQALDFVLSKLDYTVGTRSENVSAPGRYEIPKEIVSEAIVNAVTHRDYTHNGSVQVMLFRDRLEVINPGALPLGWTVDKLNKPHPSVPFNPLLAEPMYLKGYIERMGTGTADIIRIALKNNLKEPVFEQNDDFKTIIFRPGAAYITTEYPPSTDEVPMKYRRSTVEVRNLIKVLDGEMSRKELQQALELKHEGNFRDNYLEPALNESLILFKFPDIVNHRDQKYKLSEEGLLLRKLLIVRKYEGVNLKIEGVNEGVNEGVKSEIELLYQQIANNPGKKASELSEQIGKSLATTERYLKTLKDQGYIEFRGAPKTGGYYAKKRRMNY
jgi:predicted HTH transcriptional regulator